MNDYLKELEEIQVFSKLIADFIEKNSLKDAVRILCNKLWNMDYETYDRDSERIKKLEFVLSNIEFYTDYRYQHDVLCYIVKSLNIYNKPIPKRNILSCGELREYDPVKNGQNILKHDISFGEFTDGGCSHFGNLIIQTRDGRGIYFAKFTGKGSYGLCICEKLDSIENDLLTKIQDLCHLAIKIKEENKLTENERHEFYKEKLSTLTFPSPPRLRIISAMKFTKENYRKIIESTLKKDKSIPVETLECFIEDACKCIESFIHLDE